MAPKLLGLDRLSEGQRRALMVGAPLVAAVAIGSVMGKRNADARAREAADAEKDPGTTPTGFVPPASTDVVGIGQLAEFESIIASSVVQLAQGFDKLQREFEEHNKAKPAPGAPAAPKKPTPGCTTCKCISLWGDDSKLVTAEQAPAAWAWVSGLSGAGGWNDPALDHRIYDLYGDAKRVSIREMAGVIRARGTPTKKTRNWRC